MTVKTELTARPDAGARGSDILLIHTGGTIGMGATPAGLAPVAGLLERAVEAFGPADGSVTVVSFDPLVDSADITHEHWNRIVSLIEAWDGAGVIVTHGTDTMSFTGAALSQALSGLTVPVVLCGAMQPLGTGGDAEDNLKRALEAAAVLEKDRVSAGVLHVATVKPLDEETLAAAIGKPGRLVVVAENHSVVGGFGEAVLALAARRRLNARIQQIGLPDAFLDAGALPTLHDRYGMSAAAIVARVKAWL